MTQRRVALPFRRSAMRAMSWSARIVALEKMCLDIVHSLRLASWFSLIPPSNSWYGSCSPGVGPRCVAEESYLWCVRAQPCAGLCHCYVPLSAYRSGCGASTWMLSCMFHLYGWPPISVRTDLLFLLTSFSREDDMETATQRERMVNNDLKNKRCFL